MERSEETIFAEALEKPAEQRAGYLDKVCAGDPKLRENVESLLDAYAEGEFLESPARELGATLDQPITEKPGTQIGPYKLLQQLGEGGMGVVYMAEQKEPVKRRVALKIIKPGMDTRQVIARFEAERQALAMMDHPNIAKVLDAGATESGRPYFVMELVNGLPVTQYCDEQHLTPKERLELFVPICQAVQHAHQKGIIHRDLKPSNILVAMYDNKAVPKIIDFGVAKATSQTLTDKTMFTQLGQVVGTLEYMSPEQAQRNQLDIDTRSDIYSLGVVLYELLTGETPFDRARLRSAAFDEMLRIIREEEPSKPSTKVSSSLSLPSIAANRRIEPAKLGSMIRGELDWIVLKAMEKDRGRRYETASKFAEDVQHYLNDEPVVACPPSAAYRFKKLVRRNKAALVTTCVVAAALLLGLVGTTRQMFRAMKAEELSLSRFEEAVAQRQRADAERDRAVTAESAAEARFELALDAIDNYYTGVSEDVLLQQPALVELREQLLEQPLAFYKQLRDEFQNEKDLESTIRLAEAYSAIADINAEVGSTADALQAYEQVLRLHQQLVAEHSDPEYRHGLATTYHRLSVLYGKAERCGEGLEAAHRALELRRRLVAQQPAISEYRSALSKTHYQLARLYQQTGKYDEALEAAHQARDLLQPLVDEPSFVADYLHTMGHIHNMLGLIHHNTGDRAEALADYARAREIQARLVEQQPEELKYQHLLAGMCINVGTLYWEDAETEESLAAYRQGRDILLPLVEKYPTVYDYQNWLAKAFVGLGRCYQETGMSGEALESYQRAVEIAQRLVEQRPEDPEHQRRLVNIYNELAMAWGQSGMPEPELAVVQRARIFAQRLADEHGPDYSLANQHNAIAVLLLTRQELHEAEAEWKRALEILIQVGDRQPSEPELGALLAGVYNNLGMVYMRTGRPDEALATLEQGREMLEQLLEQQPGVETSERFLAITCDNLASIFGKTGKHEEALAALRQAREIWEQLVERRPESKHYQGHLSATYHSFANALEEEGDLEGAIFHRRRAVELDAYNARRYYELGDSLARNGNLEEASSAFITAIELNPSFTSAYIYLANVLSRKSDWPGAIQNYDKAIAIDPENATAHNNRGVALLRNGQFEEAMEAYRTAIRLQPNHGLAYRNLAGQLANCADSSLRNPTEALKMAQMAAELMPGQWPAQRNLGYALYRCGEWESCIQTLNKEHQLVGPKDWLFLAMAHWQQGDKDEARKWYDRSIERMKQMENVPDGMIRFRQEAEELMGIGKPPSP